MSDNLASSNYIELAADIVSAYVSNNSVPSGDLPALINDVHGALLRVAGGISNAAAEAPKPAVPIKKSVTPDYIICLDNGKKFKSLKRHLRTDHNLSPEDYRSKWGLPRDYPMVAANYAASRSELATKMGLGRGRQALSDEGFIPAQIEAALGQLPLKEFASAGEVRSHLPLDPVQAEPGMIPDECLGYGQHRKGEPLRINRRPPIHPPPHIEQAVFPVSALEGSGQIPSNQPRECLAGRDHLYVERRPLGLHAEREDRDGPGIREREEDTVSRSPQASKPSGCLRRWRVDDHLWP